MADEMVDLDFYTVVFVGEEIKSDVFHTLEAKAERQINKYCGYYFDNHTLEDLELDSDRRNVKLSICAQIEYFNEIGKANEMAGDGQVTSIHIGNTTKSYGHLSLGRGNAMVSQQALDYLEPTGLLYRGVDEYGR